MATSTVSNHHEWRPTVRLEPINPKYEDRMYVSGFLFFIGTQYKREMVSHEGMKEIWECAFCGQPFEHEYHSPRIIRTDRIN